MQEWIPIEGDQPIGMLDSGVGGLAVARALINRLPSEQILYVGDTAHFPYGTRSSHDVVSCVRFILDYFAREKVKLAVMACNTASAVALPSLRDAYPFPLVGVIEAGVRMAVRQSRNGCIGVLATERTVASGAYEEAVARLQPGLHVVGRPAPELVAMVEEGFMERDPAGLDEAIREYVEPLLVVGADTIILGCTHFLALRERILRLFPGRVAVVDPAAEAARQVAETLATMGALAAAGGSAVNRFLISGDDGAHFRQVGSRILGTCIAGVDRLPVAARVN